MSPIIAIGAFYAIVYMITLGYSSYLINDANSKIEQIDLFQQLVIARNGRQQPGQVPPPLTLDENAKLEAFKKAAKELFDKALGPNDVWKVNPGAVYVRAITQRNAGIILLIKSLAEIGAAILLFCLVKQGKRYIFNIWILFRMVLAIALLAWLIYLLTLTQDSSGVRATVGVAVVVLLALLDCPCTCCLACCVGWSMKRQDAATADRELLGPGYGLPNQGLMQGSVQGIQGQGSVQGLQQVHGSVQKLQQKPMVTPVLPKVAPAPQNPQQPPVAAPAAPKVAAP